MPFSRTPDGRRKDGASGLLQVPALTLGDLERDVLEILWQHGPLPPAGVHARLPSARTITVNTVSSALTRLQGKALLAREKVSHAYVYRALVSREDLQRELIRSLGAQFGASDRSVLLAAFVDHAEREGEETLRELEQLIAARLAQGGR